MAKMTPKTRAKAKPPRAKAKPRPAKPKPTRATKRIDLRETPVEPWQFLVRRHHPWRKQLYLKGRNLTARQLVGSVKANQFDELTAAQNHHLPVEAVREAIAYVEQHRELLAVEAEIERLMRKREGSAGVPQPVP
jgi:uncharacterized protein (DUF433 family)